MPFVYQISGALQGSIEDMMAISNKARSRIDSIDGIHHRLLMKQEFDAVASSLYVCDSKDNALKVQSLMREIVDEHSDMASFYTEWIFEILDSKLYEK